MTVTDSTVVKSVPAGISREKFILYLTERKSPAASVAGRVWDYAVGRGLDVRFLAGIFEQESSSGTNPAAIAVSVPTHSWGNTTGPSYGDPGLGPPLVRGRFTRYASWYEGGISTVARLFDKPEYVKARTIREIVSIWAPSGDNNDTERYISNVVATMNRLGGDVSAPIIAISTGHHNKQGGDAIEVEQTGHLSRAVGDACKALGMTVVYLTPDEGMGTSPLSLDTVAAKVNTMNPKPNIYLETHTEGGGGRGVFAIYPDWGDDVDKDVKNNLGPSVAKLIAAATGLGLGAGGDGVMSEKQTGVGAGGSRLGVFRATEPSKEVTRLIIEYGAHDNADLQIARQPDFYQKCGQATAVAFAQFLNWEPPIPVPPLDDPITKALTTWYLSQPAQLQGDLSNDKFYEININWEMIGYDLPTDARGIRGEYFGGWWNKDHVDPIFIEDWVALYGNGAWTPRK